MIKGLWHHRRVNSEGFGKQNPSPILTGLWTIGTPGLENGLEILQYPPDF